MLLWPSFWPSWFGFPSLQGRKVRAISCWKLTCHKLVSRIQLQWHSKLVIGLITHYIDMSALPKNRQLVFSIWNYIRDTSEIFSLTSLVKISLTHSFVFPLFFLCFSFVFPLFFLCFFFVFPLFFLCFFFVFPLLFLCFSSSFFLFSKHSYLCNKKKITRWFEHMKFIFLWKKDFTSERHSVIFSM